MTQQVPWSYTWMAVADVMAKRSRCVKAQVGAVIVDRNNVVQATGYNGPPRGYSPPSDRSSCDNWCQRLIEGHTDAAYSTCPSVHAEANALLFVDRSRIEDGTIYVTTNLCMTCAKLVANSGLSTVVMRVDGPPERDPRAVIAFLLQCGLRVQEFEDVETQ